LLKLKRMVWFNIIRETRFADEGKEEGGDRIIRG